MVAKSLDLNKPWSRKYGGKKRKEMIRITFPYIVALWNKTVAPSFFHRSTMQMAVCQERLLRSTNVATMVT